MSGQMVLSGSKLFAYVISRRKLCLAQSQLITHCIDLVPLISNTKLSKKNLNLYPANIYFVQKMHSAFLFDSLSSINNLSVIKGQVFLG